MADLKPAFPLFPGPGLGMSGLPLSVLSPPGINKNIIPSPRSCSSIGLLGKYFIIWAHPIGHRARTKRLRLPGCSNQAGQPGWDQRAPALHMGGSGITQVDGIKAGVPAFSELGRGDGAVHQPAGGGQH